MPDEIEVFGKLLISEVRDQAIRSCSNLNKPKSKGKTAKRWQKLVSDDVASVVIPDCVDFTLFYLLHAIDSEKLHLKLVTEEGKEIDLGKSGELAGWFMMQSNDGWRFKYSKETMLDKPIDGC